VLRLPQPQDVHRALQQRLATPTIASKSSVYEQYDHMVQTNTIVLPGRADASVLRLKGLPTPAYRPNGAGRRQTGQAGTNRLLAATTDGNGRACYLDPYEGGKLAVAEAARNLVCVGAKPLAVTDCLNFGNPEDPQIMWQFKECVRGIADACRAFGTPVTGGNVSFYNESPRGPIDPTPVIGMIGVIDAQGSRLKAQGKSIGLQPRASSLEPVTANFKGEGDIVILFGTTREELGGSEYLATIHRRKAGKPPRVNLAAERALQWLMVEAAGRGWLRSAHDCSEGGLAVALAESCIADEAHLIGATVDAQAIRCVPPVRPDALLFGESAGRIVASCEPFHRTALLELARRHGVPAAVIGRVGGSRLAIEPWVNESVDVLSEAWRSGLAGAVQEARSYG
jgi:phosphoribosylformylglycinamidine synthase